MFLVYFDPKNINFLLIFDRFASNFVKNRDFLMFC